MASLVLEKRAEAVAAFPASSPLHGIVAGSPEHDICGAPGYFFSVNTWHVRGLLELHRVHKEFPSLTGNATLEGLLLPTAEAWRTNIRAAADFTAVQRTDGHGLFFLHPVVGSVYGHKNGSTLLEGGDEATCIERGTCFASMTATTPTGGSLQTTNCKLSTLLSGIWRLRV